MTPSCPATVPARGHALAVVDKQDGGIVNLIRAADLYVLHVMAGIRSVEPDRGTVRQIMSSNTVTGLALLGQCYTRAETELLNQLGQLREVGQQILVATHTALESYLVNKFFEYAPLRSQASTSELAGKPRKVLERRLSRSLGSTREVYRELLDIELRFFEMPDIFTTDGCAWRPRETWSALQLISKARNEIVHDGRSQAYRVATLTDAWYPFEFARRWVALFDANFDLLLYEGRRTLLIKEYEARRAAA